MNSTRRILLSVGLLIAVAAWFAIRSIPEATPDPRPSNTIVSDVVDPEPVSVVPTEIAVTRVESVPFSEPKDVRLRFVDIVTDKPIPGITLKFREKVDAPGKALVSDRQGMVTATHTRAAWPTTFEAVVSEECGASSFPLTWPNDFAQEEESNESAVYVTKLPLYSRLRLLVSGLDPGSERRIQASAKPVPPLPPSDHPAYRSLKMERETYPMGYANALRNVNLPCPNIKAHLEFDSSETAWIVLVPYTGEIAIQMLLKDRAPVARLLTCKQGMSQDVFLSMPFSPTVSGFVRLDGQPVVDTKVTIACSVELYPNELIAEQKIAGIALVRRGDSQVTMATFSRWAKTDSSGHFTLDVPFTGRVAVAAFEVPGNDRIKLFESPNRDLSAEIDVDANSKTISTARMRLVNSKTGQVMSNTDLWFGVRDDPFALSYPPTKSDSEGWFTIEDIKALPMVDFVVEVEPKRAVRVASRPQPGGDVRVID
mgnify:CR=1 FL=1|jgi:hypothetical protein